MKKIITLLLVSLISSSLILTGCAKSEEELLLEEIRKELLEEEKRAKEEEKEREKSIANTGLINGVSVSLENAYLIDSYRSSNEKLLVVEIAKEGEPILTNGSTAMVYSMFHTLYGYKNGEEKSFTKFADKLARDIAPFDKNKRILHPVYIDGDVYQEYKFKMSFEQSSEKLDSAEITIKSEDIIRVTFDEYAEIKREEAIRNNSKTAEVNDLYIDLLDLTNDSIKFKVKNNGDLTSEMGYVTITCYTKGEEPFLLKNSTAIDTAQYTEHKFGFLEPGEEAVVEFPFDKDISINSQESVVFNFKFRGVSYPETTIVWE